MERWTVVGFKEKQFKDKDTGLPVRGFDVFVERPANLELGSDRNITGSITDLIKCWDGTKSEYHPVVGETIYVIYNRYGKIDSIETC